MRRTMSLSGRFPDRGRSTLPVGSNCKGILRLQDPFPFQVCVFVPFLRACSVCGIAKPMAELCSRLPSDTKDCFAAHDSRSMLLSSIKEQRKLAPIQGIVCCLGFCWRQDLPADEKETLFDTSGDPQLCKQTTKQR